MFTKTKKVRSGASKLRDVNSGETLFSGNFSVQVHSISRKQSRNCEKTKRNLGIP